MACSETDDQNMRTTSYIEPLGHKIKASTEPVAPVVWWLTSNISKVGVRGSNLGMDILFYRHQLSRALDSVTRVDEGRKSCTLLTIKRKACTIVGMGGEEPA